MRPDQPSLQMETATETAGEERGAELFLEPTAIPHGKNRMMAAGLAAVAIVILAIAVTLVLLIRYENLPSLFDYFT